ncbi:MAG: ParB/RepB/Spo0J family partition protein [Chloroflexi bacterium]|nr:ParB/RepB/Spo0J family partition protein [Chloroflexota bacterium]
MSPKASSRPRLADQIAARRDELRLLALPDINAGPTPAIAGVQEVPLAAITPNPQQPRREFGPVRLAELAESIRAHGLITPVLISPLAPAADGPRYQLVAGERRWRAAQMAGCLTIPALVRSVNAAQALELALIENLHRQDLSPIEESLAYRRLLNEHQYSQQQLGATLGRSQTYISKRLSLLALDPTVVTMIESGELTASAARELARLKDQALQRETAHAIAAGRLNARQIERTVRAVQLAQEPSAADNPPLAGYGQSVDLTPVLAAARALQEALAALPVGLDATSQMTLREPLTLVAAALAPWTSPPERGAIGDDGD